MPRKKKGDDGPAGSWLNTYADMVTLLLTFFILLFSISNLDKDKYAAFAEAFAQGDSVVVRPPDQEPGEDLLDEGSVEETPIIEPDAMESLDVLYAKMSDYIEENQLQDDVSIEQTDSGLMLRFNSDVFFDGYSAEVKDEAKGILDVVTEGIAEVDTAVREVIIAGHTAQVAEEDAVLDRILSSDRAINVLLYMESKGLLDPSKLLSVGYGMHNPIESNDTPEGRAANRRAEIFIIDNETTAQNPTQVNPDGTTGTSEPVSFTEYMYGILKDREANLNN